MKTIREARNRTRTQLEFARKRNKSKTSGTNINAELATVECEIANTTDTVSLRGIQDTQR
jgi:hypothetical protein